jgi:mRNA-degrading endonuclease RelE of RelBE toxin-antitoxin system
MSEETWTWQLRAPAKRTYDDLDEHARNRITDKLDDIVNDQWRDPDDYLEPLTGAPHSKLRIGQFRLGVDCEYSTKTLDVYTIERRGGAYKPGDD